MGKDKHENEDLIRYGLPEDVWFHVDALSSAHVYLRMGQGEKLKELDEEAILEVFVRATHDMISGAHADRFLLSVCIETYRNAVLSPCEGQQHRRVQTQGRGSGLHTLAQSIQIEQYGSGASRVPRCKPGKQSLACVIRALTCSPHHVRDSKHSLRL